MLNITRYYLKKLFREFYCINGRLLLMVAVFSFYTSYEFRILDGSNCSVTEYALYAMSDYYYFIFFFLVIYGVILFGEIKDSSLLVLQRTTKYGCYYAGKMAAIFVFTSSIILLHMIIAILIGAAGHGWGNTFAVPEGQLSEIGLIFQDAFRTPAGALAAVCCYRILGLSLYAGILFLLSHYIQDRKMVVVHTIVYLLTIVTLHKNADRKIPLIFLSITFSCTGHCCTGLRFRRSFAALGGWLHCLKRQGYGGCIQGNGFKAYGYPSEYWEGLLLANGLPC